MAGLKLFEKIYASPDLYGGGLLDQLEKENFSGKDIGGLVEIYDETCNPPRHCANLNFGRGTISVLCHEGTPERLDKILQELEWEVPSEEKQK